MGWLFTDPVTAGTAGKAEVFHFYVPWIIVCTLGLLIPMYYFGEGRRRFFGRNALNRYQMNKLMRQIWPWALVGWFLIFARFALDDSLFAWRFWRYAWVAWAVVIAGRWLYYLFFRYGADRAAYLRQRTLERYYPQPRARRRTAKAGAR